MKRKEPKLKCNDYETSTKEDHKPTKKKNERTAHDTNTNYMLHRTFGRQQCLLYNIEYKRYSTRVTRGAIFTQGLGDAEQDNTRRNHLRNTGGKQYRTETLHHCCV